MHIRDARAKRLALPASPFANNSHWKAQKSNRLRMPEEIAAQD